MEKFKKREKFTQKESNQHVVTPYPAWSKLVCVEQKSPDTPTFCENEMILKSPFVVTCTAFDSTFDWPWLSNTENELPDCNSPVIGLYALQRDLANMHDVMFV